MSTEVVGALAYHEEVADLRIQLARAERERDGYRDDLHRTALLKNQMQSAASSAAHSMVTALERIQALDKIVKAAVAWVEQEKHGSDDGESGETLRELVLDHIDNLRKRS